MKNKGVYIPSVDGKDICLSKELNDYGFTLKNKKGNPNLRRYRNVFDYSLDLIKLREVSRSVFWGEKDKFTFEDKGKEYCPNIINLNFKYSIKEYNKIKTSCNGKTYDVWIKYGYKYEDLNFDDCVAYDKDKLVGVICGKEVIRPNKDLKGFKVEVKKNKDDTISLTYSKLSYTKTIKSVKQIREELYRDGFTCDGIKYVRFKRSSGSARVGKCLFINERLYEQMFDYAKCGLEVNKDDEIDLASFEAYIALSTSSIIDTLKIEPKNFLIVDDFESVFTEEAVITRIKKDSNQLETFQGDAKISNSIFDGQGLIDISLMGDYKDKGMLLLRNRFFKSCCFNTNIQKFFKDNNINDVSQLNGSTIAESVEDIKVITTPSSIKYYKFDGDYRNWLANIDDIFGVVKYDKDTHYFDGELVQTHYQLINTLQFTREEMQDFLQPSLDYLDGLNMDKHVMRNHIKWKDRGDGDNYSLKTKSEIVYEMLGYDNGFEDTKIYHDFKKDVRKSFVNNIKKGHVYINGTYAVLLGNPYEMLLHSIDEFNGVAYMDKNTIYNKRYKDGEELLCCRSPHVTISNIMLSKNKKYDAIDEYFNLTSNIVCINSIEENVLERLSGADFDSDSAIITNDKLLVKLAKINYDTFKVPTSLVEATKTKRYYNSNQMADLDIKTSENQIGEIINCSQILNSLLWDKLYQLKKDGEVRANAKNNFDEIKDLFYDICQLDVMSCIEIDKAKKEFVVNNKKELDKIRKKYREVLTDKNGKNIKPRFFRFLNKSKGYYIAGVKNYNSHETAMDYLSDIMNKRSYCQQKRNINYGLFSNIFMPINYDVNSINKRHLKTIRKECGIYSKKREAIWAKEYLTDEEKIISNQIAKNELMYTISNMDLNNTTMFELIKTIDMDKYKEIHGVLSYLLFQIKNKNIENLLKYLKKDEKIREYCYFGVYFSA